MSHACNVAAGILPAVEGGILPPGSAPEIYVTQKFSMPLFPSTPNPPGKMPGSTAAKMAAATHS
jgi:hypothetical protein